MFDTKTDYKITTKFHNKVVTHVLRQPTVEDIHLFEKKRLEPMEIKRGEIIQKDNSTGAFAFLWGLLIISVAGYKYTGKNWKEKVPVLHKIPMAKVFGRGHILEEQEVIDQFGKDKLIESDDENIVLYYTDKQRGEELLMSHEFRTPTPEDNDEFSRIDSLSKTKTKKSKLIIKNLPTTKHLCNLYDSMIIKTKGYLDCEDFDVPVLHKVVLIKELFNVINEQMEEIEGN